MLKNTLSFAKRHLLTCFFFSSMVCSFWRSQKYGATAQVQIIFILRPGLVAKIITLTIYGYANGVFQLDIRLLLLLKQRFCCPLAVSPINLVRSQTPGS